MVLEIEVKDKITKLMPGECQVIVCDNTDYSVHFAFDEEWDEADIKTARFIYGDEQYTDVSFTGDTVAVPKLTNTKYVLIGVFVNDLLSTTAAKVLVLESIRTPDGDPIDPTSAEYDTIIELINSKPHLSENDVQGIIAEYLAAHPETDPTVPDWAKAETKPSYTADEVGAYTKAEVDAKVAGIDLSEYAKTADVPTKTSQLTNDSGYLTEHQSLADYATTADVDTKLADYQTTSAADAQWKLGVQWFRQKSDSYSKSETDTLLASAGKVKTVNGVEPDASGNITIEGGTGKDGTTFTPSVSADGTLSWTNDGGKDNPASVNIKGAKGDTGAAPNLQIGDVTTLAAGSSATATIIGTAENPVLNLGIPKGADGSGSYELPVASSTQLGGVKPVTKTDEMTQEVGVDEGGALFTVPSGEWALVSDTTITEPVSVIEVSIPQGKTDLLMFARGRYGTEPSNKRVGFKVNGGWRLSSYTIASAWRYFKMRYTQLPNGMVWLEQQENNMANGGTCTIGIDCVIRDGVYHPFIKVEEISKVSFSMISTDGTLDTGFQFIVFAR